MTCTSEYEDIEAGGAVLHEMDAERAAESGDRPALIEESTGQVVTYGTLASRIGRVAAGLTERGFGTGDVLAQWAGVALGAIAAGRTVMGSTQLTRSGS